MKKHQIECEEKFFCTHSNELISFILNDLNFKLKEKLEEQDIYLKDKNNKYIQKNACLRVRKTNNAYLELTRKSAVNHNYQLKEEKNIPFPIQKEERLFSLLNQIGISKYCIVHKQRTIYSKTNGNLIFNVVLDVINQETQFLELEIVSFVVDDKLEVKLQEFIALFSDFDLKKANINYRDFIINQIKS